MGREARRRQAERARRAMSGARGPEREGWNRPRCDGPVPSGLSADEKLAYERLVVTYREVLGFAYQMGLRPHTLYGLVDSPVGLAAYLLDHDGRSYQMISRAFSGQAEEGRRPHARRRPGQRRAHLVHGHGGVLRAAVLGAGRQQADILRRQGRLRPGRRERLPRRALSGSAKLGGDGVSQARPLQQARQGRPLRGLGAAAAAHAGDTRGPPVASLVGRREGGGRCMPAVLSDPPVARLSRSTVLDRTRSTKKNVIVGLAALPAIGEPTLVARGALWAGAPRSPSRSGRRG